MADAGNHGYSYPDQWQQGQPGNNEAAWAAYYASQGQTQDYQAGYQTGTLPGQQAQQYDANWAAYYQQNAPTSEESQPPAPGLETTTEAPPSGYDYSQQQPPPPPSTEAAPYHDYTQAHQYDPNQQYAYSQPYNTEQYPGYQQQYTQQGYQPYPEYQQPYNGQYGYADQSQQAWPGYVGAPASYNYPQATAQPDYSQVAALTSQPNYPQPTEYSNTQTSYGYQYPPSTAAPAQSAPATYASIVAQGVQQSSSEVAGMATPAQQSTGAAPTRQQMQSSQDTSQAKWAWGTGKAHSVAKPKVKEAVRPAFTKVEEKKQETGFTGSDFPPSLRAYVTRAFARAKTETQREALKVILGEMFEKAKADRTLLSKDWDTEPLPVLPDNLPLDKLTIPAPKRSSRWESQKTPPRALSEQKPPGRNGTVSPLPQKEPSKQFKWEKLSQDSKQSPRGAKRGRRGRRSEKDEKASSSSSDDGPGPSNRIISAEESRRREKRSKRFESLGGGRKNRRPGGSNSYSRRETVAQLASFGNGGARAVEDIDWDSLTVKGTSEAIEKPYLRLTSAPEPSTVRPEAVLRKSLAMVESTEKNYFYRCEQLKSIRQDLTVQRIRNAFTAKVYEVHGRMALESGDMAEYNQCQTQLKVLYGEGVPGAVEEFTAYRLLYIVFHQGAGSADLLLSIARLRADVKASPPVHHALCVRKAMAANNYVAFFRLYKEAPNLGSRLMDLRVEKVRFKALQVLTKAYRPSLAVSFVARALGFWDEESEETEVLEDTEEWLAAHGAVCAKEPDGERTLDTKVSVNQIFMPEETDAVAHGDPTLAAEHFLAKPLNLSTA